MKHTFKQGQVVYIKNEGEYVRFLREVGEKNALVFNPRWGGRENHRLSHLRPLSLREKGGK